MRNLVSVRSLRPISFQGRALPKKAVPQRGPVRKNLPIRALIDPVGSIDPEDPEDDYDPILPTHMPRNTNTWEFDLHITAFHVLQVARASVNNAGLMTPDHLIHALNETEDGFTRIGLRKAEVRQWCRLSLQPETMRKAMRPAIYSHALLDILTMARNVSSDGEISRDDLILGILYETYAPFDRLLKKYSINKEQAIRVYSGSRYVPMHLPENKVLDQYCVLLNKDSHSQPVFYRDHELQRLEEILMKKKKKNALLLGEPGVGKTAIVEGFAWNIKEGVVPMFRDHLVYSVDLASLYSGTKERGELEERWNAILQEVANLGRPCILFIDEVHVLLQSKNQRETSGMSLADILKPAMSRENISIVASTTQGEYQKHFYHDKAFERRFSVINCHEPTPTRSTDIINSMKYLIEEHHGCVIPESVVKDCVAWAHAYIPNRKLPDKAIDVLDDLGSDLVIKFGKYTKQSNQTHEEFRETIETLYPERVVSSKDLRRLFEKNHRKIPDNRFEIVEDLEERLNRAVIGQKQAVSELTRCLQRSLCELQNESRPMGCFFFAGHTGVGKTLLATELANHIQAKLHRLDMSEYMEDFEVSKLIGSPPGYIGYEESGSLYQMINTNAYNVFLLDEFEKAHPRVQDLFLQIMQDGIATNSHGRKIYFRDTILIFTSNIQIRSKPAMGFVSDQESTVDYSFLKERFRPEFLNRLDAVIPFLDIQPEDIRKIVRQEIRKVQRRYQELYENELHVTHDLIDAIVEEADVSEYGARNIRRLVEQYVNQPTVDKVLHGHQGDLYISTH